MHSGLSNKLIGSLIIDSDNIIFAGKRGGGVYTNDIQASFDRGINNIAHDFNLKQNYPNSFNPETTIGFSLSKPAKVKLEIYGMLGQRLRVLVNEQRSSGDHTSIWDGHDDSGRLLSSGNYLYRMETNDISMTKRLLFLK